MALPEQCAHRCEAHPHCNFFTHSKAWQDCFLCKECILEGDLDAFQRSRKDPETRTATGVCCTMVLPLLGLLFGLYKRKKEAAGAPQLHPGGGPGARLVQPALEPRGSRPRHGQRAIPPPRSG